ncbi:MAG: transposase [Planctomycetaceae bacterium]|nr:transposase [Planctomycetales bacterium]MCB9875167.1 transposase [Planctomycetaceae bacterium]
MPHGWNMSRFLAVLGESPHRELLQEVFNVLIQELGRVVPDLGANTAGDATQLSGRVAEPSVAIAEAATGLPQPSGGRKEYTDDAGRVTKVVEWFGYKPHLLVDVKHEVALAYEVTDTKAGNGETLPALVTQAQANLPADRIQTLAYDKAADTNDVHAALSAAKIKPVIQNCSMWKEEHERMLPAHDGNSNIVYDEVGTLYCYD